MSMTRRRTIILAGLAAAGLLVVGGAVGAAIGTDRSAGTTPVATDPPATATVGTPRARDRGDTTTVPSGDATATAVPTTTTAPAASGVPDVLDAEDAIEHALAAVAGTVIDVDLDDDDARLVFEVEVVTGEGTVEVTLDAHTGAVIGREPEDSADAAEDAARAARARITAADAVRRARAAVPGRAVDLELDDHAGTVVFEIEVVAPDRTVEVVVDAVTGEVIGQWPADDTGRDDD